MASALNIYIFIYKSQREETGCIHESRSKSIKEQALRDRKILHATLLVDGFNVVTF